MTSSIVSLTILAFQSGLLGQPAPAAPPPETAAETQPPAAEARAAKEGSAAQGDVEQDDVEQDDVAQEAPPEAPAAEAQAPADGAAAEQDNAPTTDAIPFPAEPQANTATEAPQNPPDLMDKHPVANDSNTFKPGTGLSFKSKDELFSMAIRLRVQFRDELLNTHEEGEDVLTNRFGIRRARLQFKGNVFSKKVKYKAEFALSPNDLGHNPDGTNSFTPLLDWYTEFVHLRDLSLRVGQYKLLYSRQRVVSSGDLEFVDRNLAQNEFNLDRDVGAHFFSENLFGLDLFKYYAGISIAEGRDSWDRESTVNGSGSYQTLVRLEVLPFGDFDDYSEVDFSREKKLRVSLGGAYAFTKSTAHVRGYQGAAFADGGTANFHNATADLIAKYAGLTLYSDFFFRQGKRNDPVAAGDEDGNRTSSGIGGSAQLGYLFPVVPVGVGVRYAAMDRAGNDLDKTTVRKEQEVGGTLGWYIAEHCLKLQADYFHIWSEGSIEDQGRIQLQVAY